MAGLVRRKVNTEQILNMLDTTAPKGNDLVIFKNGEKRVLHCNNRVHKIVLKIINLVTPGVSVYSEGTVARRVNNTIRELNKESNKLVKLVKQGDGLESLVTLRTILETFKENKTQIKMIKIWAQKHDPENKGVEAFVGFHEFVREHINERFQEYSRAMNLNDMDVKSPRDAMAFLGAYNELVFFNDVLRDAPEAFFEGIELEKQKNTLDVFSKLADEKYEIIKKIAGRKIDEYKDTSERISSKLDELKEPFERIERSAFDLNFDLSGKLSSDEVNLYLTPNVIEGFRKGEVVKAFPELKGIGRIRELRRLNEGRDFLAQPDLKERVRSLKLEVEKTLKEISAIKSKYKEKKAKLKELKNEKHEKKLAKAEKALEKLLRENGFLVETPEIVDNETGAVLYAKLERLDADPHSITVKQIEEKLAQLMQRSATATIAERKLIQVQVNGLLTNQDQIVRLIGERDIHKPKVEDMERIGKEVTELKKIVNSNRENQKVGMKPFAQMLTQVQELIDLAIVAKEEDDLYLGLLAQKASLERNLTDLIQITSLWNDVLQVVGNKPQKIG